MEEKRKVDSKQERLGKAIRVVGYAIICGVIFIFLFVSFLNLTAPKSSRDSSVHLRGVATK